MAIVTVIVLMSIHIAFAFMPTNRVGLQRIQRRLPPESNLPEVDGSGNVPLAVQGVSSNEGNPGNSGGTENEKGFVERLMHFNQ